MSTVCNSIIYNTQLSKIKLLLGDYLKTLKCETLNYFQDNFIFGYVDLSIFTQNNSIIISIINLWFACCPAICLGDGSMHIYGCCT